MGAKMKTNTVMMMVMVVVVGVSGQGQQARDVCFPGEGNRIASPSNGFLPTVEKFSYDLFDKLSASQGERSLIISPYSVWSVLALAYFGSLGVTQAELQNALGFANKTQTLANWNALKFYFEEGSGSAILNAATNAYFSNKLQLNQCLSNEVTGLKIVDFTRNDEARRSINADVSRTTRGRIPELITFLPSTTRFALVNAVFFKGDWAKQFDPQLTRPQEFLVPPGISSGVVQMMNRVDMMIAGPAVGLDAQMVELPYMDSDISMFLLLPNNPKAPTNALVSRLNANTFAAAVRGLPQQELFVSLSVPKFKMSARFEEELKTGLSSMGISSLFDPSRANLEGFATDKSPLRVDTAIHQATVEFNEEGTVAAAATALINTRIGPKPQMTLIFNRPFVFLIVEKRTTRIPLFMGKVTSATDLEDF